MTPSSKPRLPAFDAALASPEQTAVLSEILAGPRGNLNGPFLGWIHSPELAQHAQRLGAFCRYQTGLSLRLSELAILVTAARWQAQAEWYIHYPIALKAGVPETLAEQIRTGAAPEFEDADDALVYAFTTELYDGKRVSDATYARAVARFGHETTINLVGLLGYYALVAMTLNVFEMRAEGQTTLPFAE
ncbi:carboxymuconolactone decarboxylase family protein [Paraburkholderia acidisoli]|uniref:Carboxymuconolactone decarboxylase family protein n=1 Tax=Paraburkholderia acidisoli TaxID=2571748 RepID=A0A7Z2GKR3_9BURK|nr:carboxymuconolactone decarboxylase family protein [Paraburkholderia acidisoli]QGZ63280.1 carboxymuconolactone decarboxylase family protein [Paraburkholderia acidisoli]